MMTLLLLACRQAFLPSDGSVLVLCPSVCNAFVQVEMTRIVLKSLLCV